MSTVPIVAVWRRPAMWWAPAVAGVAALLARPWFLPARVDVGWRVAFFVALGAVGMAWPLARESRAGLRTSLAVFAVGGLGFVLGRALLDVPFSPRPLFLAITLNALAAVAEEAFFRRYLYAVMAASWGPAAAVVLTAALFALVHVTVWGWWVLPLDLAAGLVFSWQRAASGRWSVAAATHVLANTLALL